MDTAFFKLPRELRDTIYKYYFHHEDGYEYHHDSGKMGTQLSTSASSQHSLALMYTCRAVYQETKYVALSVNTFIFRPYLDRPRVENDPLSDAALLRAMLAARNSMLSLVVFEYMEYLSKHDIEELERLHPHHPFLSCIRQYHDTASARYHDGSDHNRQQTIPELAADDLTFYLLLCDAFDMISRSPSYDPSVVHEWLLHWKQDSFNSRWWSDRHGDIEMSLLTRCPLPWAIPTRADLREERRAVKTTRHETRVHNSHFSAASLCIHFLRGLDQRIRLSVKHILLEEDRRSNTFPESHALGLIRYCQENDALRIERRIDIFSNIMSPGDHWFDGTVSYVGYNFPGGEISWENFVSGNLDITRGFNMGICFREMYDWLAQALLLESRGMPTKSFALTFAGLPRVQRSIWSMLKQVAVAQEHIQETYDDVALSLNSESKATGWYYRRDCNDIFLVPSSFAAIIRAIVAGKTFVQADTGSFESLDPQKQPKEHIGWSAHQWSQKIMRLHDSQVKGYDYPAEGALRPPPGVIEDMLAYNGITIPDDMTVDWENIYNSINDPFYEDEEL
ncbi:hypothetical protein EG328_004697 [Venturia inaequalis]|uniref:Uncharacterized protein n=1 Tax=Venturia inaequalis TaxID=5025 RepID=A0A8H3U119_VENIN|nr:hypothetical protein EG328_004697 [Venturia inaequalis]